MKGFFLIVVWLFFTACSVVRICDEINFKQFNSMIDNKADFVLYVGSDRCLSCREYKSTLNKVIEKYNLDVKYINMSKLSKKERELLSSKYSVFKVPVMLFIDNGKENDVYNRINGNVTYSKIVAKFKENDYIKG